jgi:hypothetical protein
MYNLSFEIPRAPLAGLLVAVAVAISKTSKLVEPVTSRIVILPVPAAIFSLKSSTRLSAAPTLSHRLLESSLPHQRLGP